MTRFSFFALAAMFVAGALAVPASAAPIGANVLPGATKFDSAAAKVHFRRHRHCHWRHGVRYCHGWRYYRDSGPSIGIYFGKKRHHRHHHHRRWHHD